MLRQPLVSIIVNCFNGEKYLRETLDSVITQTYKNWEIIFWDNQSSDISAEIFKSYQDSRLKYYLAPSHTKILYEARNYALKKATGDFIAFLDADDYWLPDKLEKQIPLFNDSEVGLVYGNLWYLLNEKKKKILRKKALPTGMVLNELLSDYVIRSATIIIRKKSLESLEYYFNDHFHIIGDFDLSMRIAAKWKLNCVQSPIAFVRIHGKNESLLNKNMEINEMKNWYTEMKKNPIFSTSNRLNPIEKKIFYLETLEAILSEGFRKSFFKIVQYPLCFKKLKLIIALLLPKFVLKKIKPY